MLAPIHEQRFVCCLCESAPGKIGEGDGVPLCIRCRTKSRFAPREPWPDMPTGPLDPHMTIARDAMLAAYRAR